MDIMQQGVITLLKSAVTGEKLDLPRGFDLAQAYPRIRAHHMTTLVYTGAVNCGIDRRLPVMQQLFQGYCRALQVCECQMHALNRVFAAFDAEGIDYLPMKGSMMRALYPRPELRMMGDADVLIRLEQYERIVPILQKLGFVEGPEGEHHYAWKSDALCLELHKTLFQLHILERFEYFRDAWPYAHAQIGTRYAMDEENTFAYLFTHFSKHYSGAGIGCRHVVDLWVYLRSHPHMDEAKLDEVLDPYHLTVPGAGLK